MVRRRLWRKGGYLHITVRGNRKENIFRDENDYKIFMDLLKDSLIYFEEDKIEIATYCLMTNHVHLLIKTNENLPGRVMAKLLSRYTSHFNKKYNYVGRVFQCRYKSEFIKDDMHLLEASRYIILNPCRANIVKHPKDYKWGCYNSLIGKAKNDLISEDIILGYFNEKKKYEYYKEFIEGAL